MIYKYTPLLLILLQGCAAPLVPNDYKVDIKTPDKFYIDNKTEQNQNIQEWWNQFQDPVLSQLIMTAQKNSSDISRARLNLKNYETQVVSSRARNLPSLGVNSSANRGNTQGSLNSNISASLQTSWELDLFGINNLNNQSKSLQVEGAEAQLENAQIVVAAETARSYFNYYYCLKSVDTLKKDYQSRTKQYDITSVNVKFGLDAQSSLSLSEANLAESQSSIVAKQSQCDSEFKGIVALTGYEHEELKEIIKNHHPEAESKNAINVPTSIPAQLITQRPDVYNAYRNIQSKALDIGVAKGQAYPKISFSGNILAGKLYGGNETITGTTWSIGPLNITLPIFDGGVIKANAELSKVAYENAKVEFGSTLRTAIQEIETSYIKLNASNERLILNAKATDGYKKSLEASTIRYDAGLSNLYELEDSRRSYLNSLNSTINNQNERVNSWINLYKAMGGGFNKEIQ